MVLGPAKEREELKVLVMVVSDFLRPHGLWSTRLLRPWDFPGKIPWTEEPGVLEWVAIAFSIDNVVLWT